METFSELKSIKNLSLALGYFDGVHLGHQSVIKSAVNFAKEQNTKSAVVTFKDHPCCYFYGVCPKYILPREERKNKIEALGIDYLFELDFEKISKLSASEYLEKILVKNFSPCAISTGFNHNFGSNKSGNTTFLAQMADKYRYKYFAKDAEKINGEVISSTAIRNLLSSGNIEAANNMLGYTFLIKGTVIKGQQLGRQLGFRTANMLYPTELIDLPFGVYSTIVTHNGCSYKGITNFGIKPTVSKSNQCLLETHILNFDKDIYGESLQIEFVKMLRPETKFNSLDELKNQIKKDIRLI